MTRSRAVSFRKELCAGASLAVAVALALAGAPATASDAPQVQTAGGEVFKTYCASCHGLAGKGDGPLAEHLRTVPPDLTRLAKRNRGDFSADQVRRIIDGRDPVKGHGGPDMPIWGDAFKQSREGYSEEKVKARIASLVEFLESVQVAPAQP